MCINSADTFIQSDKKKKKSVPQLKVVNLKCEGLNLVPSFKCPRLKATVLWADATLNTVTVL